MLEIGAGTGNLTRFLLSAKKVIAVEKDRNLEAALKRVQRGCKGMEVLIANILDHALPQADIIIGNIPYNVAEPLLYRLMHASCKRIVLLLSTRLYATLTTKKLSLIVPHYFVMENLMMVPRAAFAPKPRIDSVLIRLTPTQEKSLIRAVLDQHDKRVKNAVEHALWQGKGWSKRDARKFCRKHLRGIADTRLRQLSFTELKRLLTAVNNMSRTTNHRPVA